MNVFIALKGTHFLFLFFLTHLYQVILVKTKWLVSVFVILVSLLRVCIGVCVGGGVEPFQISSSLFKFTISTLYSNCNYDQKTNHSKDILFLQR